MGTLIGVFDALLSLLRRRRGPRAAPPRSWRHGRFVALAVVLAAATQGLMLAAALAPIPALMRGLDFTAGHVQPGLMRNGSQPPVTMGVAISVVLLACVFAMGLCGQCDCRLCFEERRAAGCHAIQMRRIELPVGEVPEGVLSQLEIEAMSHIDAPFVDAAARNGCGLCEYRCHHALCGPGRPLSTAAIAVEPAGRSA